MRILSFSGLAVVGLMFSPAALAACETVLAPQVREINAPGAYCLSANRNEPIVIRADNVELDCRGRSIARTAHSSSGDHGVHLARGNNVTVRNCRFEGWNFSLLAEQFENVQILNNSFLPEGIAITLHGSDRPEGDGAKLIGNRIFYYQSQQGAEHAIGVWHSPRAVLTNNLVAGFRGFAAVRLDRSPDAQLTGNQLLDLNEGGASAFDLLYSPRARFVHNTVMLRRGVDGRGLRGATDATCIENVFINAVHSGLESCVVSRHNLDQLSND